MLDLRDLAQLQSMQVLAWTLVHFLWQGAVLGLGAFLVLRIVRPERASTRYAVARHDPCPHADDERGDVSGAVTPADRA